MNLGEGRGFGEPERSRCLQGAATVFRVNTKTDRLPAQPLPLEGRPAVCRFLKAEPAVILSVCVCVCVCVCKAGLGGEEGKALGVNRISQVLG